MPPDLASFPSLESRYPPPNQYRVIPLVELMKVWELIFNQVDWSEMVEEAGGGENPDTYRDVFKMIMHSHIKDPLKQEEDRKDMRIELGKRDDAGTESWNDSSEDGDNYRHLEDHTILESVESSWGSEDYIDDETDDEENGDDEEDSDDEQDGDDN